MGKKDKLEKLERKAKARKEREGEELTVSDRPEADVAMLLVQAARGMRTLSSRNLAESGLYAGQDGVMLTLQEADGMTAGALAARLGVKAPTMTRTIGRMEAQGFLERRPDPDDARLTKVYLTDAGRGRLEAISEAGRMSETVALQGFSDKQVRTLAKLLRALDENLQPAKPA